MLDVFMEIYAITVIATLAGAMGSFLQKRGAEIDEAERAAHRAPGRERAARSAVDEQAVERAEQRHRAPRDAGQLAQAVGQRLAAFEALALLDRRSGARARR